MYVRSWYLLGKIVLMMLGRGRLLGLLLLRRINGFGLCWQRRLSLCG